MGWLRRKQEDDDSQRFRHNSGHDSLREVILEQAPNYETPDDVTRPRGRAYRLHPDDAPPPERPRGHLPPLQSAKSAGPDSGADTPAATTGEEPNPPLRRLWDRAE